MHNKCIILTMHNKLSHCFFKTPRKCQCFGICCEGSGTQIFYLVDEAQHSNKGANTVTSMLHHHFMYHGLGETDVKLHMDNCSGQNKNYTVIGYGMWRVMTGLHESVEFSMMEAGHTKFNPDWHFGLWKVKWRHSNVKTLAEIAASVLKSSRNGHNVPQLVDDPVAPLFFYDWATFFKRIFKPIPSLKSYHHFRMDKDHPGIVFVREYATSQEVSVYILKPGAAVDPTVLPLVIPPSGLDAHRQWYLFNEVAPYCVNKESCPKPTMPKPLVKIDSPSLARKCSKCKLTGHNKTTCRI
nr:uncharacterized protein LOC117687723 [Crassostrea gigas]